MTLFHVAPHTAQTSIRERGLNPALGRSPWAGMPSVPDYPTGTYLFGSASDALKYVAGMVCERGAVLGMERSWDVWAVDSDGLALAEDPLVAAGGSPFGLAYYSAVPIRASRVRLLNSRPLSGADLVSTTSTMAC